MLPPIGHRAQPKTGVAFAGIVVLSNWREYLCGTLHTALNNEKCYNVQLFVNPQCYSAGIMGIENLGVYFSEDSLLRDAPSYLTLMPYTPQIKHHGGPICDTMNWTKITGSFIATGGEQHFVIGNFDDDQHTNWMNCRNPLNGWEGGSYYYIDDVSVWPCDAPVYEADAGNDKRICFGDEITIGQNQPDDEYRFLWSVQSHRLTKKGIGIRLQPHRILRLNLPKPPPIIYGYGILKWM